MDFVANRLEGNPPDLVVPIGAPATQFAIQNRGRLFSGIPMLIGASEPRTLPRGALTPMTAHVAPKLHLPDLIDNILRVLPETKTIAIAIGTSRLEQFWRLEAERDLIVFSDRVQFRWLNELSLEGMKQEISKLPANSAVLHTLLFQDASGLTLEQDQALTALRSVAKVPFFSCYESELGSGIIGGRLMADRSLGVELASAAVRILQGELPANCSRLLEGTMPPRYDWRELQRFGISESLLPPGSTILFRPPTLWQQYHWYVIGTAAILGLQTLLIAGLLIHRRRRARAESALAQSERRLHLIADSLPALIAQIDRDGRFLFANRAYEERFGFGRGEVSGRKLSEVLGEPLYQSVRPYTERVLSGEQVTFSIQVQRQGSQLRAVETGYLTDPDPQREQPAGSGEQGGLNGQVLRLENQPRAVEATYVPDRDERGRVRGYYVLVIDVTDRNLAQQQARISWMNWLMRTGSR